MKLGAIWQGGQGETGARRPGREAQGPQRGNRGHRRRHAPSARARAAGQGQARIPARGARSAPNLGRACGGSAISSPSASIMPTTPPNRAARSQGAGAFQQGPNCVVGPNDDVVIPKGSVKTDWEVELAIVIGSRASYVSENKALDYVAGYCICNDVSEREFQLERSGQWVKGKSARRSARSGLAGHPDEIADVQTLDMWLDVNGERMQTGSTATMIFDVKTLSPISRISCFSSPATSSPPARRPASDGHEAAAVPEGRRYGVARRSKGSASRPSGSSPGRGRLSFESPQSNAPAGSLDRRRRLRRLLRDGVPRSYVDYLRRAGTWFADLPLTLAALPFTLTMRALNGGSYAFGGDMTGRVVAAGVFGSALAYLIGLALAAVVRRLAQLFLAARWSADRAGGRFTACPTLRAITSRLFNKRLGVRRLTARASA